MTYEFLSYLCCCCGRHNEEDYDIPAERDDETSRLIPDSLGSIYSDPALTNQHRIQQKLDDIVRAKERKMVNVASQIPFNLHNQVLPPEVNHSLSRNASQTFDYFGPTDEYNAGTQYRQQPYPHAPYKRFTTSDSPDPYHSGSRSRSRSVGREPPSPILNVRLVGYVDRRGRTMHRNKTDPVLDAAASESTPTPSTMQHIVDPSSPTASPEPDKLKLHDVGAVSLSWGD